MNSKNRDIPITWIITEGLTGTENQCRGVAEALGLSPEIYRIGLNFPWNYLSPWIGYERFSTFNPPIPKDIYPDLLITSGRKSIAASRYIKKHSKGKTFTVQLQDPRINPNQFDMVAVPLHDPTRGENVLVTQATPNRITPDLLADAKTKFAPIFEKIAGPRVAVLIGGSTKRHKFTPDEAMELIEYLVKIPNLMITTSRRTGPEKDRMFRYNLGGPGNYLWDGTGDNPYMGMLAWADYILVTADSTAMISDAATTGKPVYILPMQGLTHRQDKLVENLIAYGAVRRLSGDITPWTYEPLQDSAHIAAEIRRKSGLFSN